MGPFIPYEQLLSDAWASGPVVTQWLREELTYAWHEAYLQMSGSPAYILFFTHGSFDYLYDRFDTLVYTSGLGRRTVRVTADGAVGLATPNAKPTKS